MFKKCLPSILLVAFLATLAIKVKSEGIDKHTCASRSGFKEHEITEAASRNLGCMVDCTTIQGEVLSFNIREDKICHGGKRDYRCKLGKCRSAGEEVDTEDTRSVKIRVISAHVPDRDPYPAQGESDTLIAVKVTKNAGPIYDNGQLVCYTWVVQDTSYPKWNFECKPSTMKRNSILQFVAVDSDKPAVRPDDLGTVSKSIDDLLNRGPMRLPLNAPGGSENHNWYVEVEVSDV